MATRPSVRIFIAAALALLLAPGLVFAGNTKRDRMIRALEAGAIGRLPVIVRAKPGRETRVRELLSRRVATLEDVGADVQAQLTADDVKALAATGDIDGFSYDAPVVASGRALGLAGGGTSLMRDLVQAPADATGRGIGVAIIDSGIAPVRGVAGRIRAFYDFTGGRIQPSLPHDAYGHGTHIASVIGASLDGGPGGVAPEVHFIGLRVLGADGSGRTSDVIRAIDFAVATRRLLGIRVLNLSLGHPIYEAAATDPLVQAVERAVRAGLVVVTAAGNFGQNRETGEIGYAGITSPGNAPSAITVGATVTEDTVRRSDDRVAAFSSRGPTWYDALAKPDVVAPGVNVEGLQAPGSTLARQLVTALPVGLSRPATLMLSGTSMATAVTTGVAALTLEASAKACDGPVRFGRPRCPALTPNAVKAILQFTATPIYNEFGEAFDALSQGRGEINASGAVAAALAIDTTVPMGHLWLRAPLAGQTAFDGEMWTWAGAVAWGNRLVSGGVLDEKEPAWAQTIVWGTDLDTIVWGTQDTLVWGTDWDTLVWGTDDTLVWGTLNDDTIVWSTDLVWHENRIWPATVVWGTGLLGTLLDDTLVWGTAGDEDTIVWGVLDDTVVWGTESGTIQGTGIVWGNRK